MRRLNSPDSQPDKNGESAQTGRNKKEQQSTLKGAMLLAALSASLGGLLYLQDRATSDDQKGTTNTQSPKKPRFIVRETPPAKRAKHLANTKALRGKWRSWALRHKEELARMLRAKSGDQAALMAVWKNIPGLPTLSNSGFDAKELSVENDLDATFSWNAVGKLPLAGAVDAEVAKREAGLQSLQKHALQEGFKSFRDIEIADCIGGNNTTTALWASGRITAWSSDREHAVRGRVAPRLHRELVPPYDFLQAAEDERKKQLAVSGEKNS